MQTKLPTFVLACAMSVAVYGQDGVQSATELADTVAPIFKTHCFRCHGRKEQAGDLRLDTLSTDLMADQAIAEKWQRVLEMLQSGEMPPAEAKRLRSSKRNELIDSISQAVSAAMQTYSKYTVQRVPRRLNRVEYGNTMFDLLGLEMDYARDLPADSPSKDGFYNDGQALQMSAEQLACYLDTARRAMDRVIVSGPAPKVFKYEFAESNVGNWKGEVEFSNRLGRQQEFIVKMVDEYPEQGEFLIRVKLSAVLKPNMGYPLLEVSLGYRPDTEILFGEVATVEITDPIQPSDLGTDEQVFEFRGRVEEYPLPVRGQGKFPGLVIKIRNAYDDGSPLPKGEKDSEKNKKWIYPAEPNLPILQVHSVEFQGPVFHSWPHRLHHQILFESELRETNEPAYVAEVLKQFLPRAFRRPVETAEVERVLEFYQSIRSEFPTFEEAMREALSMVLISPGFLYLMAPPSNLPVMVAGSRSNVEASSLSTAEASKLLAVDDWALASRLSYFLWSTMPDAELQSLAASGRLRDPVVLSQQVERLLRDARSNQFTSQFTDQWLAIDHLRNIAVSPDRFPNFDDRIKLDMQRETQQFFRELLDYDLSALNLLESDFVVVNERMAKHYGIEAVWGTSFRRVAIEPTLHRGGLLGQASVLLSNSTGRDSHPVRRAVWLRDRILNDPPAPPPADVPPLDEADPRFHEMSVRQQLEIHRNTESCARCHRSLDPWGIALENFDALGLWRDDVPQPVAGAEALPISQETAVKPTVPGEVAAAENSQGRMAIDAQAIFPDGRQIDGVEQLQEYLVAEHSRQFAQSLVSRLLTYALGRSLGLSDQGTVARLTDEFVADGYRLKALIKNVVATSAFQNS